MVQVTQDARHGISHGSDPSNLHSNHHSLLKLLHCGRCFTFDVFLKSPVGLSVAVMVISPSTVAILLTIQLPQSTRVISCPSLRLSVSARSIHTVDVNLNKRAFTNSGNQSNNSCSTHLRTFSPTEGFLGCIGMLLSSTPFGQPSPLSTT